LEGGVVGYDGFFFLINNPFNAKNIIIKSKFSILFPIFLCEFHKKKTHFMKQQYNFKITGKK